MNKYLLLFVLLVFSQSVFAQKVDSIADFPSINQRDLQILTQQWINTDNAAGLAFSNVNKGGFTTFENFKAQGNHHRVQEGSGKQGLRFYSEGYSSFNEKIFARGHFAFNKYVEHDRGWSDVVNTYNSNPYIFGSSVRGDYDNQNFDLSLKIYSATIGKLNYGLSFDYKIADISRQRDPRTRTYMIDYSITPSITYGLNNNSRIGLNAYYRYGKERMPSISTVQTDPNLQYYTFTGLQNATGRIGGYKAFQRQFISDFIGSALQYNYDNNTTKLLLSAGVDMQWQQTLGNRKQSPGSYNSYNFNLLFNLIHISDNYLHNAILHARYADGGANEYRQSLFSVRDTVTGISTEYWVTDYVYKNRFVVQTADVNLSWKTHALKPNKKESKWSLGFEAAYISFSNVYFLPKSEYAVSRFCAGINGSIIIIDRNNHAVEFYSSAMSGFKLKSKLDLIADTEISEQILQPDLLFHNRNTIELTSSLRYTFPIPGSRASAMTGYVKLYADNLFANKSYGWFAYGLAIGLLTF